MGGGKPHRTMAVAARGHSNCHLAPCWAVKLTTQETAGLQLQTRYSSRSQDHLHVWLFPPKNNRVGSEVSQNPVTFTTESTKQWEPFLFPKWVINTPCSSLLQRERSYLTGLVGLVASQISPKSEPSAIPNSSCFILPSTLTNRGVKQENGGSQQGALSCRCDQETKEALGNSTQ